MKNIITIFAILLALIAQGQQPQTIYCNTYENLVLLFPAAITQGVTGSENFLFSYNESKPDSLGLLQGRPGLRSNLIVRTADGGLYTYRLEYKDSLPSYTYSVAKTERICEGGGDENFQEPSAPQSNADNFKSGSRVDTTVLTRLSRHYLNLEEGFLKNRTREGVSLGVVSLNYYHDYVYMVYRVKNRSQIDFEIDTLELYFIRGVKSRRSSFQKLPVKPIFSYQFPKNVGCKEEREFVLVYPKFSISSKSKLEVQLREKNGARYISVPLKRIN